VNEACRSFLFLNASDMETQSFEIQSTTLSPSDSRLYVPIIFRTANAQISFRMTTANGNVKFQTNGTLQLTPNVASTTREYQVSEEDLEDEEEEEEIAPGARKLMKAGGSGGIKGGTYASRSRIGSGSRFGGYSYYGTGYGYYGYNCILPGTVIYMYSSAPYYRYGYYDNGYSSCSSSGGCTYEVPDSLSRDELDDYGFTINEATDTFPLTVTIDFLETGAAENPTANYPPQLFITFWTDEYSPTDKAGITLMAFGSFFIFPGTLIIFFVVKCCSDDY